MYRNILLPVVFDEDENTRKAFDIAKALASEGASLTILHVAESIPAYALAEVPEQVLENNRREMKEALAKMASDLPGAKSVMIKGHSGRSIVQYAKDHEIDCIVMSSHQPGLEHFFLGSTADRVVRHATCAVHVIR